MNGYWFTSSLFQLEPGEDAETNPGIYGKRLSHPHEAVRRRTDRLTELQYQRIIPYPALQVPAVLKERPYVVLVVDDVWVLGFDDAIPESAYSIQLIAVAPVRMSSLRGMVRGI